MSSATPSGMSVLLVEDNPAEARFVVELLKDAATHSIAVALAPRLEDALSQLRSADFSVILLDLSLPDSQGFATFARARAGAPSVPIVVLSGLSDEEVASRAVREGAQDYLVKGTVDGPLLYRAIRYAVERHSVREELRASEARYRSLVDGSLQGILIDVDGTVQLANRAASRLFGVDRPETLVGASIWPFIAPEDRGRVMGYAQARHDGQPVPSEYQCAAIRHDGEVVWLDCLASVVDWEGGKASMTALIDVTERRRAEQQLRETEERFRQLADNIKEALIVAELPSFRPSFVSRMWGEIWQTDPEEALRQPTLWIDAIDPQDRAAVDEGQRRIERGEPAVNIFRIRRPDGSTRWARARMFPVVDGAGTVFRAVGLIEDITEIRHTEDLLRHAQKMEAVGRLAGGIAHDFNNLVTVILGYSELALGELSADHPIADAIGQIRTAGESAAGLTRQLLAFSRRQILEPRTIDLNAVLLRLRLLLRRVIGDDIHLHLNLTPTLAMVEVDPGEIERVVMNLAVNARDAMPDGGHLTIESAIVELDEAYARAHPGTAAGSHVMLAVSDSGIGMDDETQRQVFEPFFSTKGIGQGTGLGLATVYGIVKQSGGSIWVYSETARGTTFKIYLPRATSHAGDAADERSAPETWRGSETVLVVEDQPELRTLVCGTLQRHGYRVLSATNGEEAFHVSAEHKGELDLLLTDVVMAGLNGRRVAQRLHLERPQMRVIYMSGYTDQTIVRHGVLEPGLAFLQKPFTIQTLLRRVRETLDAAEPPGV